MLPYYGEGTNHGMPAGRNKNQAKTDANLMEMKEEMTARPKAMIMNNKERLEPNHEKMDAKMDAYQEKM
jgi:hypothetical protein